MRGIGGLLGLVGMISLSGAACSSASGGGGGNGGGANASGSGGSSASSGSGGGSGATIGDGGGATGGLGPGCASNTYTGELIPLDMYVMLDRSSSMVQNSVWTPVTSALKQFTALPNLTDLGMGLAFFPASAPSPTQCTTNADCTAGGGICIPFFNTCEEGCQPTSYSNPTVGIAPLPGVGSAIASAIDAVSATGDNTPTRPALQGAMMYALDWATSNPDRITVVVLATDGEPTGCMPNSVTSAGAVAAQGLSSNPSVRTFVIGLGALGSLDAIAQQGGTGQAIIVSGANPAQQFLAALDEIRGAVGCVYKIPTPTGGETVDFGKVNVAFTPTGGTQEIIPQVAGVSACLGQKAWYYDDPQNPSQILLCPAACDLVQNTPGGGTMEVVTGCTTIVR